MPRTAPTPSRRCIHLVDIENLLGGWVTDQRTRHLVARYHSTGLIGSADLVIVAGAHRAAARWAFAAPQGWRRIITADRPDAADDALVKAGQAYAFSPTTHLVIGSGDHYFIPVAEKARAAGAQIHGLIGEGQVAPRVAVLFDATTQIGVRIRRRPAP